MVDRDRTQQHQDPFQVVTDMAAQTPEPVHLSTVGNYALNIEWRDGHRAGAADDSVSRPVRGRGRAGLLATRNAGRIGVPTQRESFPGKKARHSSNPVNTASQNRAVKRFAFPGIAFESWTKVRQPILFPATTSVRSTTSR